MRTLGYFAATEGSFAGAARQLDVSVPSVHKLVTSLEARRGVRLFDRSARGLTLTASGETYLESCRPLLDEMCALDLAVSRSARGPSGTLVIGAPSQLAHHLLLPALPRLHAHCPEVQIDLRIVHRLSDAGAATAARRRCCAGGPEARGNRPAVVASARHPAGHGRAAPGSTASGSTAPIVSKTPMRKPGASGLVYSTDSGRMCPSCRQPAAACACGKPAAPKGDGVVRVSRETKGRGGKTVTLVRGLDLEPTALAALGKQIRTACGAGGSAKDGVLEVQGDHAERIVELLQLTGQTVKRAGG